MYEVLNKTNKDMSILENVLKDFLPYAHSQLKFDKPVVIVLRSDEENAKNPMGITGYYEPDNYKISVYTDNRHPKDILRSISHELVHHKQNCEGKLKNIKHNGEGYAQTDKVGRECESEAYLLGNGFLVRDFQDLIYNKGEKKMLKQETIKEVTENIVKRIVEKLLNEKKKVKHDCANHVKENSSGRKGKCINHTLLENGDVTHYTVEFADEIVENIPVEKLTVLKEGSHGHSMKRDDYEHDKDKPRRKDEDLEEAHCPSKRDDELEEGGLKGHYEKKKKGSKDSEDKEETNEEKMPDENKDGIPDYAQDGKGKNDLGKTKGAKDDDKDDKKEEGEDKEEKSDKDLSKVPPQLRKHMEKKKNENLKESFEGKKQRMIFEELTSRWFKK
jgi:hypothetical protein